MSLKSGWLVAALMVACLAGASRADGPTTGVVTFECDATGRFGSWFWGWKQCGANKSLHHGPGCRCGKPACVPYLPEGYYGYHETCWRPWTFPRQCPRCLAPQPGLVVSQPSAPLVELAAPTAGPTASDEAPPAPKNEFNPSPYR